MMIVRYSWLLLVACKEFTPSAEVKQASSAEGSQEFTAYLDNLPARKRSQAKVNPDLLTIDLIKAGIQSNKYGKFVRLYFYASIQRDYLEIARCPVEFKNNMKCLFDKDVVSTAVSVEDVSQFKDVLAGKGLTANDRGKYDCWNQGVIGKCTMLKPVFEAEHHIDLTAGDGRDFFYVARPCIIESRVNEIYTSDSQICSDNFIVSNEIKIPVASSEREELQKKIDGLSKRLTEMNNVVYQLTLDLSQEMEKHEEEMIENQRKKNLREGISTIIGMGVGVIGSMYSMSHTDPSMLWKNVGKEGIVEGAKTRVLEEGKLQQLVEHKPAASDAIGAGLEAGKALGAAIADVLASPDDYPTHCYKCLNIRASIAELTGEMEPDNPNNQQGGHIYRLRLQEYQDAYQELQKLNEEAWLTEQFKQETEKSQGKDDEESSG